jgi:squalene cyclase
LENVKNYQSGQRVITLKSKQCNYNLWEMPTLSTKYSVIKIIHAIILAEKSATQLPQKVHEIVQQFSDR